MKEAVNLMRAAATLLEKANQRLTPAMAREDVTGPLHNSQVCLLIALERATASPPAPITHHAPRTTHHAPCHD